MFSNTYYRGSHKFTQGHIFLIDSRRTHVVTPLIIPLYNIECSIYVCTRTPQVYTGVIFFQQNFRERYNLLGGVIFFERRGCRKYCARNIVYIFNCFIK